MKPVCFLLVLFSSSAFAAQTPLYSDVKNFLKHSPDKRPRVFQAYGHRGKSTLAEMAFNSKESLEVRWDALVTLGRIDSKFAKPHLEKALVSSDWFMRNAALIVVSYGERDWAIQKARLALHDPALVVRTAAVKVLSDLKATEAKPLLWEKINSSENFKRGQSLWIRPLIAQALVDLAQPEDKEAFQKLLKDRDGQVQKAAQLALASLR